jgi:hypothetical protein
LKNTVPFNNSKVSVCGVLQGIIPFNNSKVSVCSVLQGIIPFNIKLRVVEGNYTLKNTAG